MQEHEQAPQAPFGYLEAYDDEEAIPTAVLAEHSIRLMHQILGRLVPETHDPRQIAALSMIANGVVRYTRSVYRFEPGCEHLGDEFITEPVAPPSLFQAYPSLPE